MIRGAFILAVGFSLGYIKAMSEQEAIASVAEAFKQFLEDTQEDNEKSNTVYDEAVSREKERQKVEDEVVEAEVIETEGETP